MHSYIRSRLFPICNEVVTCVSIKAHSPYTHTVHLSSKISFIVQYIHHAFEIYLASDYQILKEITATSPTNLKRLPSKCLWGPTNSNVGYIWWLKLRIYIDDNSSDWEWGPEIAWGVQCSFQGLASFNICVYIYIYIYMYVCVCTHVYMTTEIENIVDDGSSITP